MKNVKTLSTIIAFTLLASSLPVAAMKQKEQTNSKISNWFSNLNTTNKAAIGAGGLIGGLLGIWTTYKVAKKVVPTVFRASKSLIKLSTTVCAPIITYMTIRSFSKPAEKPWLKQTKEDFVSAWNFTRGLFSKTAGLFGKNSTSKESIKEIKKI